MIFTLLVCTPNTWIYGKSNSASIALLFIVADPFGGTWYTPVIITLYPGINLLTKYLSQYTIKFLGTSPVGIASDSSWILNVY